MFQNNVPFRSWISKRNSTLIDNAEDLDIAMLMYNLLEYSQNYYKASGSLWNYYRNEIDNINGNVSDDKLFKYETNSRERPRLCEILGDTNRPQQPAVSTLNVKVTIPLKKFFWRILDLPLINCKIELDLTWTKDCVLIEHDDIKTGINFMITNTKLYVPAVSLSINDNIKILENIKERFKRTNIGLK